MVILSMPRVVFNELPTPHQTVPTAIGLELNQRSLIANAQREK